MLYYFPMILIVVSVTFYNICQKSTPASLNPYAALMAAYFVSLVFTSILFLYSNSGKSITSAFEGLNWTTIVLGITIVGIELGYLFLYRAGWSMNVGSLVASITIAIVLIAVGHFFYREGISTNQIIGVLLCVGGMFFINK